MNLPTAAAALLASAPPATAATQPCAAPEPIPRTQVERAYRALRQDIVQGTLPPGDKLRVEHLKDRYEVGAGTLREALSLLVSDALVTAEGQRGFRVATASLADLEDVTRVRVMLETEALRQSIRHGDARWEAELHAAYTALAEVELAGVRPFPPVWEALNHRFHEALIAAHASEWTRHFLDILHRHAARYRYVALRLAATPHPPRDVHAEHEALFQAAIQRREARAALLLEDHVCATLDMLRSSGSFSP